MRRLTSRAVLPIRLEFGGMTTSAIPDFSTEKSARNTVISGSIETSSSLAKSRTTC